MTCSSITYPVVNIIWSTDIIWAITENHGFIIRFETQSRGFHPLAHSMSTTGYRLFFICLFFFLYSPFFIFSFSCLFYFPFFQFPSFFMSLQSNFLTFFSSTRPSHPPVPILIPPVFPSPPSSRRIFDHYLLVPTARLFTYWNLCSSSIPLRGSL